VSQNHMMNHFIHSACNQARKEKEKGNTATANAIWLFVAGMLFLPIPIIGIPLIIASIVKGLPASDQDNAKQES
jgi:hypothetical protein